MPFPVIIFNLESHCSILSHHVSVHSLIEEEVSFCILVSQGKETVKTQEEESVD